MQVICKVCGASIEGSSQYCPYCGAAYENVKETWNDIPDPMDKKYEPTQNVRRSINIPLIACAGLISFAIILGSIIWILRQYNSVKNTSGDTSFTISAADNISGITDTTEVVSSTEGGVTALIAEVSLTVPDDLDTYHKVSFISGDASSVLERVNELYHYEPSRAFDGDQITSWQEGNKTSDGQGEWLELHMNGKRPIKYITLCLGNWRDSKRYESNNRPREMQIRLGGMTYTVHFSDIMKPQYVTFSKPVETDSIRFIITDVVVGSNGDHDCCISEVYAYSSK